MAWAAFACPDACQAVWDNIASAWLGSGPTPPVPTGLAEAPIEDSFWQAFWAVVDGHDDGYDALTITEAVASLGAVVVRRPLEIVSSGDARVLAREVHADGAPTEVAAVHFLDGLERAFLIGEEHVAVAQRAVILVVVRNLRAQHLAKGLKELAQPVAVQHPRQIPNK